MEEIKQTEISETPVVPVEPTPTPTPAGFDWTKLLVPGSIVISGLLIASAVLYSNGLNSNNPANLGEALNPSMRLSVSDDGDPFLGNADAPVVLIEFSDFQCPFCRRFWRETLPSIKEEYIDTGKVKFVYRDMPLSIHPAALPAAMASHCAEDQGKYWEYHDKMYIEQDKSGENTVAFGEPELRQWAREIGMEMNEFNECLDTQKYYGEVEKDSQDGFALGIDGTPTTFVNGRPVVGALSFQTFKALIEEELKQK